MTQAPGAAEAPEKMPRQAGLVDRALEWTVLAALLITVGLYILAPLLAIGWAQRPFIGAFVEKTFVFNGIGDPNDPAWSARQRVPEGDVLLAVNGQPVTTSAGLGMALAGKEVGDTVRLTTRPRAGGAARDTVVTLSAFPLVNLIQLFIAPYLIGVIYLGIGWWVFRLRRGEPSGRAFALTCALTAVAVGAIFDLYTTHWFTWAWTIAVPNLGAAAISLALVFPKTATLVSRRPLLRLIGFIPGLALAAYALATLYAPGFDAHAYVPAWRYGYFFLGAGLLTLIGLMFYRWRSTPSPAVGAQSRIIFFGSIAAFLPLLVWVVQGLVTNQTPYFNVLVNLGPLVLFPAAVAYAILRYRLLDADVLLGQGIVYAILGALTVAGYSLIITGLTLLAGMPVNANDPLALGLVALLLVIAFNPLRERLQRIVNAAFFRGSQQHAQRLEQFGRALTQAPGLIEIAQTLNAALVDVLKPTHAHVFLRDEAGDYAAAPDAAGRPTTDLQFAADSALAFHLTNERASLLLLPDQPLPQRLARDRARLAVLGSALFAPMPGKNGLTGWLAVGPKQSGDPFQTEDLRFVESLADQAALAIERATVISDLERRVKELNVVSQMSQAVSFTRAFDDLLELIYAQASKILDARNFYLLLKDRRGVVQYTLFIENDERLNEREGRPAPTDAGLEPEVMRTGQAIRVDDYTQECHRRGVTPGARLYRAWLGVPLNAGADTIGAMIVAAADPTVTFTEDQAKVFATIADQAASAIVRARLLQQAEQRARQLATLNEVSLTIASTLELDPLLQKIVQSAASILNCEAGSLFLTDAETGESVFRVATGPVGRNLVGMRIAAGKGFVGEAIETGRAVIVNDAQSDPRWFRGADQSTGFITQALITVPLRYQGRPIGAIQLINKRDGAPFDEDDQSLLTAFATPSAIAIENARLFTQTDQALAARVEELSIMQRIGRELNTTLDTALVANITLNWAMKSTGATAGWVGLAEAAGIRVIECEGYGEAAARLLAAPLPADHPVFGRVLSAGDLLLLRDTHAEPGYAPLLESTRAQLSAPIRRNDRAVGLVTLESIHPDAFTPEHAAFVTRLLDLTSIALTNSRLYADLEKANADKSDLMSFVAHELKTPMTPIKGYADLLASASVGPVNDMQRQFLDTIRKNIERMTVIVNDLNDAAKIEAGKLKVYPKSVALAGLVEDVVRTIRSVAEAKQQTVTTEVAPDLAPAWVDPYRVSQVLTNLVSNAHKYTPEGGRIHIRVAPCANHADPDGPADMLQVSVQDNGLGIAPEEQKKIFQKFFRSEDRQAREMAPGTGLGLNIVKSLVELQGGQIWFESEFRKGSAFHFTVPTAGAAQSQPAGG